MLGFLITKSMICNMSLLCGSTLSNLVSKFGGFDPFPVLEGHLPFIRCYK